MAPSAPGYFAALAALGPAEITAWVDGEPGDARRATRRWFDTFDWRLWHEDLVLEADEIAPDRVEVVLRQRGDHRSLWSQTVADVPRTAGDLPAGPWRRSLGPVLGMRSLVPVATTHLERRRVTVADDNGKAVAHALWEAVTSPPSGDRPARWVRVVPVRGYPGPARRLVERLRAHPDLAEVAGHPLEVAVTDGRSPGRSGVELDVHLDPGAPAQDAVLILLRHLHGSMRVVEPWLDDPPDTEFLHDFRVALRRSRSVLKLARGILPDGVVDEWRPTLRDLQQRSGPLRDLDVFVLKLPSYRDALPAALATDLELLQDLLERRRREAQRAFAGYLGSDRHRRVGARYADLLADGGAVAGAIGASGEPPDARRPIVDVAAERIRRSHRRMVRRGRQVRPDSEPSHLHRVRIAGKELRYAIELHASLLPDRERRRLVVRLKRFQDLLGAFQDAEVHAAAMESFATELTGPGGAASGGAPPARAVMALGVLARDFAERKAAVRSRFAERFAAFDTGATEELLATMLDRARGAA